MDTDKTQMNTDSPQAIHLPPQRFKGGARLALLRRS
jgi:hypothetical protein